MIEELFFELLQVAIGTRQVLSHTPSIEEWKELFLMSKKQSLVAITFCGLKKLRIKDGNYSQDEDDTPNTQTTLNLPEIHYLKWLGLTAKIAQQNKTVSEACCKLCEEYIHDGMRCCVLKGQSNLLYYPKDLRECRTPGDIDIWTLPQHGYELAVSNYDEKGAHYEHFEGVRGTIEYVMMLWRSNGGKPAEVRYHHIDAPEVDGVQVETHFRPMYMSSPCKNKLLQRWFIKHANEELKTSGAKGDIPSPSVGFNAVYQLTHIYRHLFSEGIGLRQLLDYYFVLRALHIEQGTLADRSQSMGMWAESIGRLVPSNAEIMHTLSSFGMNCFASAVMWVLKEVFSMPSLYMICEPCDEAGRFLLEEIMMAGNFGKYDDRNRQMQGASKMKRFWLLSKRNWRFLTQYPSEVLWDPFRRAYNVMWRKWELWRW